MSRFPVIDPTVLPTMQVLETISSDDIIDARMERLVTLWAENDPPNAAQYDVDALETDPLKIQAENASYFETLLRDRVNQAARAITLYYAVGGNLDAIGSRYPGGMPRAAIVAAPRGGPTEYPEDYESDERYKRRTWLSPNGLSPHGVEESYALWALNSDTSLRDAAASTIEGTGSLTVSIMNEGTAASYSATSDTFTPASGTTPTLTQLLATRAYILDCGRRGLTDDVTVVAPPLTEIAYRIRLWLFPGPDRTTVLTSVKSSLATLIESLRWLGTDHTHLLINAAIKQQGVYRAAIDEPAKDVLVRAGGLVQVTDVSVEYMGRSE